MCEVREEEGEEKEVRRLSDSGGNGCERQAVNSEFSCGALG